MAADPVANRPAYEHDAAGAPTYARGKKWPASALLAIPFAILMALLVPVVRKLVRWRACWLTVLAFEVIMLPVEHAAVSVGFWVYNRNRLLGPTVWGVPIEEPLIYYFLPPIFAIMLFELAAGLLTGAIKPDWRPWLRRWARRFPLLAPREGPPRALPGPSAPTPGG